MSRRALLFVLSTFLWGGNGLAIEMNLPRWGGEERVQLSSMRGQIVVLDFFAYWCTPCRSSSPIVEERIGGYYHQRGGNANGIPVNLFAINIESSNSRRTDRFIRSNGMTSVLFDEGGHFRASFGEGTIPFFVVLDGTVEGEFKVVYAKQGFEGETVLREVIDAIGAPSEELPEGSQIEPAGASPQSVMKTLTPARGQVAVEILKTDDFGIFDESLQVQGESSDGQWNLSLDLTQFDLEVTSPDPFFRNQRVSRQRIGFRFNADKRVRDSLTLNWGGGYYDGFSDYRSVWLNRYYSEVGNLPFLGGYPDISPRGYRGQLGFRWEYLPASGFLETDVSYANDRITPSAEFERVTILGAQELDTVTYSMALENVLHPRVRSRLGVRLIDTTARQNRLAADGSLNVALGERWVGRLNVGWAHEKPVFDSFLTGVSFDYEMSERLILNLFGRFYHDTGEIQNSLPANNAPPGLNGYQAGAGFRYQWDRAALKLVGGPYFSRYEPITSAAPFFEDLYASRDWGFVQIAYSLDF